MSSPVAIRTAVSLPYGTKPWRSRFAKEATNQASCGLWAAQFGYAHERKPEEAPQSCRRGGNLRAFGCDQEGWRQRLGEGESARCRADRGLGTLGRRCP